MPVSIKDIAKEANVSPSTVSRALNDHPRISAETKTYIQDLARAMGYVPSVVARTLVAGRSTAIGVAISDVLDLFYVGCPGELFHLPVFSSGQSIPRSL